MNCTNCGKPVSAGAERCSFCGTPVVADGQATDQAATKAQRPESEKQEKADAVAAAQTAVHDAHESLNGSAPHEQPAAQPAVTPVEAPTPDNPATSTPPQPQQPVQSPAGPSSPATSQSAPNSAGDNLKDIRNLSKVTAILAIVTSAFNLLAVPIMLLLFFADPTNGFGVLYLGTSLISAAAATAALYFAIQLLKASAGDPREIERIIRYRLIPAVIVVFVIALLGAGGIGILSSGMGILAAFTLYKIDLYKKSGA